MASDPAPAVPAVPAALRRVVTGHASDGSSVVAQQATPPCTHLFKHIPGMVSRLVWATAPVPGLPFDGSDPTAQVTNFIPGAGETRFIIVTFPPDRVFASPGFDGAAALRENLAVSPGLAERFEPDGLHTTPTVDYAIVLAGEIWLELDGGHSTHLQQHDVVIQHGTRHAWRNQSEHPATLAFVLIGASAIEAPSNNLNDHGKQA